MNQPIILASATVFRPFFDPTANSCRRDDPDVLVDARKKGLEPAAVSGDELEGLVKELVQPPEVIENISPE